MVESNRFFQSTNFSKMTKLIAWEKLSEASQWVSDQLFRNPLETICLVFLVGWYDTASVIWIRLETRAEHFQLRKYINILNTLEKLTMTLPFWKLLKSNSAIMLDQFVCQNLQISERTDTMTNSQLWLVGGVKIQLEKHRQSWKEQFWQYTIIGKTNWRHTLRIWA